MRKIIQLTESRLAALINKVIEEDTVLFRKMTLKSKFNFGKYADKTVEDVLRLGHTLYLREIYFNIEGITFTDDILERIGVYNEYDDYRIKKPGKNPELGKKVNEIKLGRSSPLYQKQLKLARVGKLVQHKNADKSGFSKKNLQRWNQGHK